MSFMLFNFFKPFVYSIIILMYLTLSMFLHSNAFYNVNRSKYPTREYENEEKNSHDLSGNSYNLLEL